MYFYVCYNAVHCFISISSSLPTWSIRSWLCVFLWLWKQWRLWCCVRIMRLYGWLGRCQVSDYAKWVVYIHFNMFHIFNSFAAVDDWSLAQKNLSLPWMTVAVHEHCCFSWGISQTQHRHYFKPYFIFIWIVLSKMAGSMITLVWNQQPHFNKFIQFCSICKLAIQNKCHSWWNTRPEGMIQIF